VLETSRRLCAGDWVRAASPGASLRGLGKITDGEYDKHDALVRARVELANGDLWVSAGELARVEPDEEAGLAERALDRGIVPEGEATERVRSALATYRERGCSRTPGLLDLLWGLLPEKDEDARVPGLVELFERGDVPPPPLAPPAPPVSREGRRPILDIPTRRRRGLVASLRELFWSLFGL
jgi:hypothetical protein